MLAWWLLRLGDAGRLTDGSGRAPAVVCSCAPPEMLMRMCRHQVRSGQCSSRLDGVVVVVVCLGPQVARSESQAGGCSASTPGTRAAGSWCWNRGSPCWAGEESGGREGRGTQEGRQERPHQKFNEDRQDVCRGVVRIQRVEPPVQDNVQASRRWWRTWGSKLATATFGQGREQASRRDDGRYPPWEELRRAATVGTGARLQQAGQDGC